MTTGDAWKVPQNDFGWVDSSDLSQLELKHVGLSTSDRQWDLQSLDRAGRHAFCSLWGESEAWTNSSVGSLTGVARIEWPSMAMLLFHCGRQRKKWRHL